MDATDPPLRLFGVPALRTAAGATTPFAAERPFQLLAHLACRAAFVPRDELAEWLWPERPASVARSNLRKVVLLAQRIDGVGMLETRGDRLRWAPDSDLARFEAACLEGRHRDALALYRPGLMEGLEAGLDGESAEWLALERARVHERWRLAAAAALDALQARPAEAAALAAELIEVDPCDEAIATAAARAELALGNPSAAQKRLAAHANALRRSLSTEPSAAASALAARCREALAGTAAPDASRPRAPSVPSPPLAGSAAATGASLVGRRLEHATLARWLLDEQRRVVSVTGPGGVGKSTLVRALLDALAPSFEGRAWWWPLERVSGADDAALQLLARLGVEPWAGEAPAASLLRAIGDAPALVAVDDGEHVEGLAELLSRLLVSCPRLSLLGAARAPLGLAHESLLPLEGLPLPDDDEHDADVLARNDAVRLFVDRARALAPGFELRAHAADINRLVRAVEGLPLAIELAASWVRAMPVPAIAAEIARSLDLLDRPGSAATPARERGVRASFEPSWRRLAPAERAGLVGLAALPDAADVAMARHIVGLALPVLATLADRSLVRHGADGRVSLHPLLRQCALERTGEAGVRLDEIAARHAAYLSHWLARFDDRRALHARGTQRELEGMLAHARAAWRHAIDARDAKLAGRCAMVLTEYHKLRGLWEEGKVPLAAMIAAFDGDGEAPSRARAIAQYDLALLDFHGGDAPSSERHAREAITSAARAGDAALRPLALIQLGNALVDRGQPQEAGAAFEEALGLASAQRDGNLEGVALLGLGIVDTIAGRYDGARERFSAAIPLLHAARNIDGWSGALNNLGNLDFVARRHDAALKVFEASLALCDEHGLDSGRPFALVNIGLCQRELGRIDEAERTIQRAREEARLHGEPVVDVYGLRALAQIALARGEHGNAARFLAEAMARATSMAAPALQIACVVAWAQLLLAEGEDEDAFAALRWIVAQPEASAEDVEEAKRMLGSSSSPRKRGPTAPSSPRGPAPERRYRGRGPSGTAEARGTRPPLDLGRLEAAIAARAAREARTKST